MIRNSLLGLLLSVPLLHSASPVYVTLWFDTEDLVEPASDDAALRIATDLSALGVRATFKVVGEKARVLESRGRKDVIAAFSKHAIGYHSNWHSVHPTPSEYLLRMGFVEGADEFERREASGVADVKRIFGTQPVCYGQPGSSWGPQSNPALRRLGIPVYLDEGEQVGLNEQPFWYGGLLHIFNMGRNQFRASLDGGSEDLAANKQFDETARRLAATGGGVISIYYHPTEFVATEFWDAVNFSNGANPPRDAWVKPKRRSAAESERCYTVLQRFVEHMKTQPGIRFATAQDLLDVYGSPLPRAVDRKAVAEQLSRRIVFDEVQGQILSPADMLLSLLELEPQVIDGPTAAGVTNYSAATIPIAAFRAASADAAAFVRRAHRLPNEVWIGSESLSLADFAATLAGSVLDRGTEVKVAKGQLAFDKYFATDGRKSFEWPIHSETFDGAPLLALGRLQGWTLKPATLGAKGVNQVKIPEYTCYRAKSPIVIDGKLDDAAWESAPPSNPFVDIVTGEPAWFDTRVRLLWDDENLYFGFKAPETDVWATLTERDSKIWLDNDLELFIAGKDAYYEFEINALNTIYEVFWIWKDVHRPGGPYWGRPEFDPAAQRTMVLDGVGGHVHERGERWGFLDWDCPGLRHAVHVDGTLNKRDGKDRGWSAEIALPWKSLALLADGRSLPPRDGDVWRIDCSRFQKVGPRGEALDPSAGWTWGRHGHYDSHIPEVFPKVRFSTRTGL